MVDAKVSCIRARENVCGSGLFRSFFKGSRPFKDACRSYTDKEWIVGGWRPGNDTAFSALAPFDDEVSGAHRRHQHTAITAIFYDAGCEVHE